MFTHLWSHESLVVTLLNEAEKESRVRFLFSMEKVKLSGREGVLWANLCQ